MNPPNEITEVTRRRLVDFFSVSGISWAGRLRESEFLARLYDLTTIPSHDHRISNAAGDIRQHRENWNDWSDDWVFYDDRFNLIHESDDRFLRFLCETVHPVVRIDDAETETLVSKYNEALKPDGWLLRQTDEVSGHPVFSAGRVDERVQVFHEPTGWQKVDRQIQKIRTRLDTANTEEDFQSVGLLCREVLISVAGEVFDPSRHLTTDGVEPSTTDAVRMIDAFVAHELRGKENEEVRPGVKAVWKLAVALQHKRNANFRYAALTAETTAAMVNMLAILSGRRS
jgi:hypothetical protein